MLSRDLKDSSPEDPTVVLQKDINQKIAKKNKEKALHASLIKTVQDIKQAPLNIHELTVELDTKDESEKKFAAHLLLPENKLYKNISTEIKSIKQQMYGTPHTFFNQKRVKQLKTFGVGTLFLVMIPALPFVLLGMLLKFSYDRYKAHKGTKLLNAHGFRGNYEEHSKKILTQDDTSQDLERMAEAAIEHDSNSTAKEVTDSRRPSLTSPSVSKSSL